MNRRRRWWAGNGDRVGVPDNRFSRLWGARPGAGIGLSGVDAGFIRAHRRPPVEVREGTAVETVDYGDVGDIDARDGGLLERLLGIGAVPVVSPISADDAGTLLNINADTVASALSGRGLHALVGALLLACASGRAARRGFAALSRSGAGQRSAFQAVRVLFPAWRYVVRSPVGRSRGVRQ